MRSIFGDWVVIDKEESGPGSRVRERKPFSREQVGWMELPEVNWKMVGNEVVSFARRVKVRNWSASSGAKTRGMGSKSEQADSNWEMVWFGVVKGPEERMELDWSVIWKVRLVSIWEVGRILAEVEVRVTSEMPSSIWPSPSLSIPSAKAPVTLSRGESVKKMSEAREPEPGIGQEVGLSIASWHSQMPDWQVKGEYLRKDLEMKSCKTGEPASPTGSRFVKTSGMGTLPIKTVPTNSHLEAWHSSAKPVSKKEP